MTDRPYTDEDLRQEAARQHAAAIRSITPSDGDDTPEPNAARQQIDNLIAGAPDVSRWAIDLGVAGLTETVSHGWYCTTTGWDLAIQIAGHPETKPELRAEVKGAVVAAVDRVFAEHGLVPRTDA